MCNNKQSRYHFGDINPKISKFMLEFRPRYIKEKGTLVSYRFSFEIFAFASGRCCILNKEPHTSIISILNEYEGDCG